MRPKWSTLRTIPIPFIPWLLSLLLKAVSGGVSLQQTSERHKKVVGIAVTVYLYWEPDGLCVIDPVEVPVSVWVLPSTLVVAEPGLFDVEVSVPGLALVG